MKKEILLTIKGEGDDNTYLLTSSSKITSHEVFSIKAAVNRLNVYSRLNGFARNWERNKDSLYREEREILEKYIPKYGYEDMEIHTITSVTITEIIKEEELIK